MCLHIHRNSLGGHIVILRVDISEPYGKKLLPYLFTYCLNFFYITFSLFVCGEEMNYFQIK